MQRKAKCLPKRREKMSKEARRQRAMEEDERKDEERERTWVQLIFLGLHNLRAFSLMMASWTEKADEQLNPGHFGPGKSRSCSSNPSRVLQKEQKTRTLNILTHSHIHTSIQQPTRVKIQIQSLKLALSWLQRVFCLVALCTWISARMLASPAATPAPATMSLAVLLFFQLPAAGPFAYPATRKMGTNYQLHNSMQNSWAMLCISSCSCIS